jgi:uncharacterized protein (TIGR02266 family)
MTEDTPLLGEDHRRTVRTAVRLVVDYDDAADFLGDYTGNLSSGGTFIHTPRSLPVDSVVDLILSFPGLIAPISIRGVVRWSRGGEQPGVGVEFDDGPDRNRLAQLADRLSSGAPDVVSRVINILFVEDNQHISSLVGDGLAASAKRTFGDAIAFNLTFAENGAIALELLRSTLFDVAIIDLHLPVLDGGHLISQARGELGLVGLPIIAVSGGGETARSEALAAGANVFVDKPMRLRQVIETISRLVDLTP